MATITVANQSELNSALSQAVGGETIVLRSGHYGSLDVVDQSFSSYVTLVSEDPLGAKFDKIDIKTSNHLRIDGVHVDNSTNGNNASKVVSVTDSHHVEVLNSEINGKVDGTYDGHYGLFAQDVSEVTFAGNYVHDIKNGGVFQNSTGLTISGNTVDYTAADSFKFIGVHDVLIEGNMGSRHIYPAVGEHNDFIQFQGSDSSDIVIRGNVSLPGTLSKVQGIFFDDAHYTNVLIEENVIVTGMIRGISVSSGTNVVARYNTVINLPGEGHKATKVMVDGEKYGNIQTSYLEDSGNGANLTLQNTDPGKPFYFADYFVNPDAGRWISLEDLLPIPGTLAETMGATGTIQAFIDGGYSSPEPELQPAPEPELQPAPEPELQPAPEPELQPAPEPELQPAPEPTVDPSTTPADVEGNVRFLLEGSHEISGSGDVIEIAPSAELKLAEATAALTFNANTVSGSHGLLSKDANYFEGGGNHFTSYIKNGTLYVRFQNGTESKVFKAAGIQANVDYDLQVSFGNGEVTAMLDGDVFGRAAFDTSWETNNEYLQIGANGWASDTGEAGFTHVFDGTISDAIIVSGVVSNEELQSLRMTEEVTEIKPATEPVFGFDGNQEFFGGTSVLEFGHDPNLEIPEEAIVLTFKPDNEELQSLPKVEEVVEVTQVTEPVFGFDGSHEFFDSKSVLEFEHDPELEIPEGTIVLTFNADDVSGSHGLLSKDASYFEGGGNHFTSYIKNGTLYVRFQNGVESKVFKAAGIQANVDYDLQISFGNGEVTAMLDGDVFGRAAFETSWETNNEYLQIGANGWASDTGEAGFTHVFDGTISDVAIFDEVIAFQEAEYYLG